MLLELTNWRCFEHELFKLPESGFCISDINGAGKTSVLAAIYTLYTGLAWSHSHLKSFLRYEQKFSGIETECLAFALQIEPSGRLKTKKNYRSEIKENNLLLSYSPLDNQLFSLSRAKKFDFVDELLAQCLPGYKQNLKNLQACITQKQAMIKQEQEKFGLRDDPDYKPQSPGLDTTLLQVLNQKIVDLSFGLWQSRFSFLSDINQALPEVEGWLNLNFGKLGLKYYTTFGGVHKPELDLKDGYQVGLLDQRQSQLDSLNRLWERELAAGRCLYGAQRDDFELYLSREKASDIFSRGQMRLLVIWLKFTGARLLKAKLLPEAKLWWLLDDALNELDNQRETLLIQKILSQVDWFVITSTRPVLDCPSYSLADLSIKNR